LEEDSKDYFFIRKNNGFVWYLGLRWNVSSIEHVPLKKESWGISSVG